jgi:hypothetical protein
MAGCVRQASKKAIPNEQTEGAGFGHGNDSVRGVEVILRERARQAVEERTLQLPRKQVEIRY